MSNPDTLPADYSKIRVIAFDLFGTVFDPQSVHEHDRDYYTHNLAHWRKYRQYIPTHPNRIESFTRMTPYPDSFHGMFWLREKGYKIVAASNIPAAVVQAASFFPKLKWDWIMDYEQMKIYKPDLAAYAAICDEMKTPPEQVLMVTGNHGKYGIGDDTAPLMIGMQTAKIRRDADVKTIVALSDLFPGVKK